MKRLKKILALAIAMAMVLGMTSMAAFADETSTHTITITNTDQNVSHTYQGYQIFKGKLDASQTKLSDIEWGDNVNGANLLAALKGSTDASLLGDNPDTDEVESNWNIFTNCSTATDVAKVFHTFDSTNLATNSSGAIDAVAKIIGETDNVLKGPVIPFTASGTSYTANVTGDGYYFIKDATTALVDSSTKGSDTLSKYLLAVVKDTTIVAKDTHLKPDKEILQNNTTVKDGTAAVGDTVTFQVFVPVPDTRKYVDHFIFDMKDKLPTGMTFMGISSINTYAKTDITIDETTGKHSLNSGATATGSLTTTADANGSKYTLTVAPSGSTTYATYTAPADSATAVTTTGGQQVKVVFNEFKKFAEAGDGHFNDYIVVTYTAVVNDDANFTSTGNKNEVVFDYSNDPNHDYDGDEPDGDDVVGTTPKDETTTYLTNIEITKTGDGGTIAALAGAEFEITSNDYNVTLVTGEKFEASTYTAGTGETEVAGTWYKLKDGSYTKTAPTATTGSSYDSTEITYKKISFQKTNTTPGNTKKVTVISGEDGKIKLEGLKPGTYTIKETKAPSGYNNDTTEHVIKIDWDATNKKMKLNTTDSDSTASFTDNTATANITIDNKGGTTLPSTGGIGTTIFYVVGAILVIGAGVVLVTRRRMDA